MQINEQKEKNLQKQLRREAINTKLEVIVRPKQIRYDWTWDSYLYFLIPSTTSTFSYSITGLWSQGVYNPVVGYDRITRNKIGSRMSQRNTLHQSMQNFARMSWGW